MVTSGGGTCEGQAGIPASVTAEMVAHLYGVCSRVSRGGNSGFGATEQTVCPEGALCVFGERSASPTRP